MEVSVYQAATWSGWKEGPKFVFFCTFLLRCSGGGGSVSGLFFGHNGLLRWWFLDGFVVSCEGNSVKVVSWSLEASAGRMMVCNSAAY